MSLIRLNIRGISYSQTQNGAYALILNEVKGSRKLPIVIGPYEAQSIAIVLEDDVVPPRPLTHDLFKNFALEYSITIKQVVIHKLVDGVFYSSIICEQFENETVIDARTSDAIALALRFKAPIFTYENILEKAGIYLNTSLDKTTEEASIFDEELMVENETTEDTQENVYKHKTITELNSLLETAVDNEDYEQAALIRDELSKR